MKHPPCNACAGFHVVNQLTREGVCPVVPVERRGVTPAGTCYVDKQLALREVGHGDSDPATQHHRA